MKAPYLRIGLVGLDTSHVQAYLALFNEPDNQEHVPGGRIVAAFKGGSPEIEVSRLRIDRFTQQAVDHYNVKLYESIEALTCDVDAIMILSVDGRQHLAQFRRSLCASRPVFIDKPLGGSLRDAIEIVRLAQETQTPCFSSSSFRYLPDSPAQRLGTIGQITAAISYGPAEREPHHPDLFWYGIHPVEALYAILGPGCQQVVRTTGEHADVVVGRWASGCIGTLLGNRQAYKGHGVTVVGTKGVLSGNEQHSYRPLACEIIKFFQTHTAPVTLDVTLEIHAFMEAADESKRQAGVPVMLADVLARAE
jgi:predicted dehydrogenase